MVRIENPLTPPTAAQVDVAYTELYAFYRDNYGTAPNVLQQVLPRPSGSIRPTAGMFVAAQLIAAGCRRVGGERTQEQLVLALDLLNREAIELRGGRGTWKFAENQRDAIVQFLAQLIASQHSATSVPAKVSQEERSALLEATTKDALQLVVKLEQRLAAL